MTKRVHNPREVAEIVAVQALSFVAGDPERLGLFLAESGIGPDTLRSAATDPHFLAGVLDFVLRDDATVKAFPACRTLTPPWWRRRVRRSATNSGSAMFRDRIRARGKPPALLLSRLPA